MHEGASPDEDGCDNRFVIANFILAAMLAMAPDAWWVPACGNIKPLQVGHDVTPPVIIKRVEPKVRGGIVILQAVINDAGTVCAARVVKTFDERVGASALEAVKQWKFRPAKLNGKPRACVYSIAVH
ncbi:MAG: energy transducer TonB [Thermoanaerobaculia bacterium]